MSRNAWSSQRPIDQETPKEGLLDLMNRLLLVGGVLHVFDQLQNVLSPSSMFFEQALLGGRREIELDGGNGGGQHDSGSRSSARAGGSGRGPDSQRRPARTSTRTRTLSADSWAHAQRNRDAADHRQQGRRADVRA